MCAIGYYASATAQEPLVAFCYPQSLLGQPGVGLLESIYVQLWTLGLSRGTILITRVRAQGEQVAPNPSGRPFGATAGQPENLGLFHTRFSSHLGTQSTSSASRY
jgi:hypothetical protein